MDHYSYTVQNFEALLLRARRTLAQREGLLPDRAHSLTPSPEFIHSKLRSSTINEVPSKGMITNIFQRTVVIIFLPISFNICFGCSKELFYEDGTFEHPQHMFWLRNKKFNFLLQPDRAL